MKVAHVRSEAGKPLPPGAFAIVSHGARHREDEQAADRQAETHEVAEVPERQQDGERRQTRRRSNGRGPATRSRA